MSETAVRRGTGFERWAPIEEEFPLSEANRDSVPGQIINISSKVGGAENQSPHKGSEHFEGRGSSPSDKSYYTIPHGKEDADSDEE